MSAADLAAVQARLANGDFAVGDRIAIQVEGEPTLTSTFTVSGTRALLFPSLPPLPLAGVLRSESDSVIREFVARYVRDPQVTVQPLVRLGVLGGVLKPGYYDVPAQSLLSEVVMGAGGLIATGRMDKALVYRGNNELLNSKAVSTAISNGSTLDLLNLQSGDNFQIGVDKAGGALTKVQIITGLLAIPIMIFTISALAK
jgi:protein involved in polysaccharide export with SLBB domain